MIIKKIEPQQQLCETVPSSFFFFFELRDLMSEVLWYELSKKSDQKRCMGKVLETRTGFNLGYLHAEQCCQVAYEPVNRY